MVHTIEFHPERINKRDVEKVVAVIANGGLAVLPSDSGYSLLGQLGNKNIVTRIRKLRELDKHHPFTILCNDLAHISQYAKVDNVQFRILKAIFPGAFTCILPASRQAPRLLQHERRKTIGIRVPNNAILSAVIAAHGAALMGVSLSDDGEQIVNIYEYQPEIVNQIDIWADVGSLANHPTTILDLTEMPPRIIRQGLGDATDFI